MGGNFGTNFPWNLHPNGKVTAVCDIRPDRLEKMATVFRCENLRPPVHDGGDHQSALKGGEAMKIRDYGKAPETAG